MFSNIRNKMNFGFILAISLSFISLSCDEICTCTDMDCLDGIFVTLELPTDYTSDDIDSYVLLWRERDSEYTEVEQYMLVDEEHMQWNIDDSLLSGRIDSIDLQLMYENEIILTNTDQILEWESFECNTCTGGCEDIRHSASIDLSIE